jgi:hypothetical protein
VSSLNETPFKLSKTGRVWQVLGFRPIRGVDDGCLLPQHGVPSFISWITTTEDHSINIGSRTGRRSDIKPYSESPLQMHTSPVISLENVHFCKVEPALGKSRMWLPVVIIFQLRSRNLFCWHAPPAPDL